MSLLTILGFGRGNIPTESEPIHFEKIDDYDLPNMFWLRIGTYIPVMVLRDPNMKMSKPGHMFMGNGVSVLLDDAVNDGWLWSVDGATWKTFKESKVKPEDAK